MGFFFSPIPLNSILKSFVITLSFPCFFVCEVPPPFVLLSDIVAIHRYGVNKLEAMLRPLVDNGLKCVLIFGVPAKIAKVLENFGG